MSNTTTGAKPVVVVVEHPNDDPSVYVIGDVDVFEMSSYPTTSYAADERGNYDTYPHDMRTLAARLAAMGDGGPQAAAALEELAVAFEQAVANDSSR